MAAPLPMNPNQIRHVSSVLRLLAEELSASRTQLPAEDWGPDAAAKIDEVLVRARDLLDRLGVAVPDTAPPARRLWALAGAWRIRVEDLRPNALQGWGAVSPELPELLNPEIDALAKSLDALAAVAGGRHR